MAYNDRHPKPPTPVKPPTPPPPKEPTPPGNIKIWTYFWTVVKNSVWADKSFLTRNHIFLLSKVLNVSSLEWPLYIRTMTVFLLECLFQKDDLFPNSIVRFPSFGNILLWEQTPPLWCTNSLYYLKNSLFMACHSPFYIVLITQSEYSTDIHFFNLPNSKISYLIRLIWHQWH